MSDLVNDYFKRFYPPNLDRSRFRYASVGLEYEIRDGSTIFPAMVMVDGLKLSVQGHYGAYSYPRDDFSESYGSVEIMGPPKADELLAPYERECNAVGDEMIYPYVPVEVVCAIIGKHGGLKIEAMP